MLQFVKGEVREIGIEVISKTGQNFVIESADYEIYSGTSVIENGLATIDGHKILTLFTAKDKGKYSCVLTYRIGPEILKAGIDINVYLPIS